MLIDMLAVCFAAISLTFITLLKFVCTELSSCHVTKSVRMLLIPIQMIYFFVSYTETILS